jgi:hypothetical protein
LEGVGAAAFACELIDALSFSLMLLLRTTGVPCLDEGGLFHSDWTIRELAGCRV